MSKEVTNDGMRYKFEDEKVWSRLSQALSVGAYIEDACVFAGISSRQYRRWRVLAEKGVEPYASKWVEIQKSEAQAIVRNLFNIQNAANSGTWQASAWILERKYPDKFARKDFVQISEGKDFDVELYWSDGNVFAEMSDMSDIKKDEEE
tara:strand:+ start:6776 stop:7222 length:447 start_codon:yes stop_codon:yes gene_type:complete